MTPKTTAAMIATTAALLAPSAAAAFDQTFIPYQPGDPQLNGCPSGWEALKVADLTPFGYKLPAKLDSGQVGNGGNGGNNDGVVCGKPVSSAEEDARFSSDSAPIMFDFRDNTLDSFHA
jgi:hypothetical protein